MILRQRLELVIAPQIGATVSDVGEAGDALCDPRADQRGAHPGITRVLLGVIVDALIRPSHSVRQTDRLGTIAHSTLRIGTSRFRLCSVQVIDDGFYGQTAGDFSRSRPAHAVADNEE